MIIFLGTITWDVLRIHWFLIVQVHIHVLYQWEKSFLLNVSFQQRYICLSFIMRIGIGCNCICSVCVQLRVRVFYYLLIDFWRKLTSTVMVWVRCYESIYYSLKWKFKKSNSITNDKYLANSEMIWAFVQFQTNEFRLKKNVLNLWKQQFVWYEKKN